MIRKSRLPLSSFSDNKKLHLMFITAIISMFVITIDALQPTASEMPNYIVPRPTATPRKVKPVVPGDINGDGRDVRTRSSPARTETVNNNESLRSTTTVNSSGAQDGSGLDSANRHTKKVTPAGTNASQGFVAPSYEMSMSDQIRARRLGPTTTGASAANGTNSNVVSPNSKALRKKNQGIEVENDETHRTSPSSTRSATSRKAKHSGKHKKPRAKTPAVTAERPRDPADKPMRKSPKP